jgi:nucleoside-diphosphate-sugar epimerase
MRYLITGGAGFIGSFMADELLRRGHRVHVLDDLSTGAIDNIRHLKDSPAFSYTIESAASASTVAELVDEADIVYHLAAAVGVELIVRPVRCTGRVAIFLFVKTATSCSAPPIGDAGRMRARRPSTSTFRWRTGRNGAFLW